MDRSNSVSSNASSSSKSGSVSGPFAYQTRLLERTSSRGGAGSLSRSNSQTSNVINGTPTGQSATRRWKPSHRMGSSVDAVRGKWEERARAETLLDAYTPSSYSMESIPGNETPLNTNRALDLNSTSPSSEHASNNPLARPANVTNEYGTSPHLKRHTMPAPIIAIPLSPNTTGVSVHSTDSPSSSFATSPPHRIHLPTSTSFQSSSSSNIQPSTRLPLLAPVSDVARPSPGPRYRHSNTPDSVVSPVASPSKPTETTVFSSNVSSNPSRTSHTTTITAAAHLQRRLTALHSPKSSNQTSYDNHNGLFPSNPVLSRTVVTSNDQISGQRDKPVKSSPPQSPSSVMSPAPYKSSYMASKYGNQLSIGRKLGRHLPRIASGDGEDNWEEEKRKEDRERRREKRERQARDWESDLPTLPPAPPEKDPPRMPEIVVPGVTSADDVAGIPGRIRLSRDKVPTSPTSPLPPAQLSRGLWADTQRQHLLAYEYLCHVGEAQQWIEGCLGEELGFGVVEMEEGLRNGVVLAKLVRAFQGQRVVRKIYEAPKLDFRHSDNINYFFNFVREVGLPEGFIFELTDLYEKKNLPKVIYCIHALSHLLARRGMAERIGNLLGHLRFSDDQLQATQKGLKDSGVAMPNFGNVGKELAKEINEEPDVEVETEDERRDRELLECDSSIIATQCLARTFLVRKAQATDRVLLRLAERYITKLQAHCQGVLSRRKLEHSRKQHVSLTPWVIALQRIARAVIVRRRWSMLVRRIRASARFVIKVQAQARGILQRYRLARLKAALSRSNISIVNLQSLARARITRNTHNQLAKTFDKRPVNRSIVALQAFARGALERRKVVRQTHSVKRFVPSFIRLQAQCRGVLTRRRMRSQMARLQDVTHVVIRIQAAVRTYLARKRLLLLIRGLRKATPMLIGLQARARANLARQQQKMMNKALSEVKVVSAVGGLQALARAALSRNRRREQSKRLEFAAPDVVGFQAMCRGALIRGDYHAWRDHLWRNQPLATILQAMLRGVLLRRQFRAKMQYYRANLDKVVKIQSLFRAKETREQYRQLTMGKNVNVGTIKNFVHLLDDSEADFQEELKVERLRKKVVEGIRENQALESDVSELDVKIALVVHNVMSFEEVIKARRRHGADSAAAHAARASVLAAHGDPFAGPNTLDHEAKRQLELYQQLFYLLQTKSEYLCRLFTCMSLDSAVEKNRRLTERVVLTLFGYGQDRREDYLLLKLFQLAIQEEISAAPSVESVIHGHPMYINVAVHYVRPKQIVYVRDTLQAVIREVVDSKDLDLEADPSQIHRARVDIEEMKSGTVSVKPKDVPFYQALNDPDTRAEYIRHLQVLQWWTEAFVTAITQSTRKMPYGMRYLARETLQNLREKFPDATPESCAACIGRLVYYRYINPAIITPETFDIVSSTVGIDARKNLAQISKVLTQITGGSEFGEDSPSYLPINEFVRKAIAQMSAWLIEVANVPDAESQFHAHEFLDATVQPKPIYISPNEVYAMHSLLSENQDTLAPTRDDVLRVILTELDGVPNLGSDELKDARDRAITLELTNRFAQVRDPQADEKALWVQAKRGVLAILRVQPAQDLVESLMRPVTDDDEMAWEDILENDMENEQTKHKPRRMPSATAAESAYRLEDIRSLTFKEVKAHAIFYLLKLEEQGKITRSDGFQGILNAIAGDVRSKHRKRLQRQQEMESMNGALNHLADRKKYFEEQINSYHHYVEAAMSTMQRGKSKKRFVLPFTKQYFHLRDLQKAGSTPQFGSFKYGAKDLYEKGILLSIDQYSPRQFDKIDLIISSNKAGIFSIEIYNNALGITNRIAAADLRMEDLLQAQFENRSSLSLFGGMVKVNLNLFLFQINKKFYV